MQVRLEFVEKDTIAEAVVSDRPAAAGKKGGEKEVQVRFSVDGKRKRALRTENGLVSFELAGLKPGTHTVRAEVVGDSAHDEGEVVIKPKTVGFWGGLAMVLYWILFGFWWGYPAYAATALGITFMVLFGKTIFQHRNGATGEELLKTFLWKVGDNNWVLKTATWMVLGVIFLWWADSTAPEATLNPIEILKNGFWGLTTTPLEDPLGEISFWATINEFLFGKKAMGWGIVIFHLWATFWAVWVSRWDEVKEGLMKIGGTEKGGGIGKIFGHHMLGEIVTQPVEWIWAGLRAPFKK